MLPTESRIAMLGLLVYLVIKTILVIVPLTVTWLAIRRLLRSKSGNAWLYAVTSMFAGITSVGLTPWAFGIGASHWVFFAFACMSPAVWVAVAVLCNASRTVDYVDDVEWAMRHLREIKELYRGPKATADGNDLLILSNPTWPDHPVPVFRHAIDSAKEEPKPAPSKQSARLKLTTTQEVTAQKIIRIAKTMRRNPSSDPRRIKLLPPPRADGNTDLPFLKSSRSA